MIRAAHLAAATLATLCIAAFFTSTVLVELLGSHEAIARVKGLIVAPGLFILIPAMAVAGPTGFLLSRTRTGRLVDRKKGRMPLIGANGLLILVPAAIFLDRWASAGVFDTRFQVLQAVELLAGAANLTMMGMNMRDGMRLSGRLRARPG